MSLRQSLAEGGPLILDDPVKKDEQGKPQQVIFRLEPVTQGIKALFVSWAIEEAWRRAFASAEGRPPEQSAKILELCAAQVNSGQYEYYASLGLQAQGTFPGMVHLLWLRLKPNHPKLTKEEIEKFMEVNVGSLNKQIKALDADPTPAAPKA